MKHNENIALTERVIKDDELIQNWKEEKSIPILQSIKNWLKNWQNCLDLFLFLAIVISGAIYFMVCVNLIEIDDLIERGNWLEISSQCLNALFTIMAFMAIPLRMKDTFNFVQVYRGQKKLKKFPIPSRNEVTSTYDSTATTLQNETPARKPSEPILSTHKNALNDSLSQFYVEKTMIEKQKKLWMQYAWFCVGPNQNQPIHHGGSGVTTLLTLLLYAWINIVSQLIVCSAMLIWCTDPEKRPPLMIFIFLPISFISGGLYGLGNIYLTRIYVKHLVQDLKEQLKQEKKEKLIHRKNMAGTLEMQEANSRPNTTNHTSPEPSKQFLKSSLDENLTSNLESLASKPSVNEMYTSDSEDNSEDEFCR